MAWRLSRRSLPRDEVERLQAAGETINIFVWLVAAVVMVFSAVAGADLLAAHGVQWSLGLAGGLAVDAALVVALVGDRQLHRYGQRCAAGTVLRWTTALMSLVLNCGQSLEARQPVAVVLHALFPVLLIVLTEASQGYQVAFGRAVLAQQRRRDEAVRATVAASVPTVGTQPNGHAQDGAISSVPARTATSAGTASARRQRASKASTLTKSVSWTRQQWVAAVELVASFQDSHARAPKLGEFHSALRMQRTAASPLRRSVLAAIAEHGLDTIRAQAAVGTASVDNASVPQTAPDSEPASTASQVIALHPAEYRHEPGTDAPGTSSGTGLAKREREA